MARTPRISAHSASHLLLAAQDLLADPTRGAQPASVLRAIKRLGYVQVDSIQVFERAHHSILGARFFGYRPRHLEHLLERNRRTFEHWTHDASVLPFEFYPYWQPRFARFAERIAMSPGWQRRLGEDPEATKASVLERIRREGPLRSADFRAPEGHETGGWWNWKPQKAALEALWFTGLLAIRGRDRFQKIYDLPERVWNDVPHWQPPTAAHATNAHADFIDWACREALDRLTLATPGELAGFWGGVRNPEARAWCEAALERGAAEEVEVTDHDRDAPRTTVIAHPQWRARVRRLKDPPSVLRLLSPFDPLVRDRARCERLFGFAYRFEAFVPQAKRRYGYYVLPLLDGADLVGRLDAKHDRQRRRLTVRGLWWEPGSLSRPGTARHRRLEEELARVCQRIGADDFELPAATR